MSAAIEVMPATGIVLILAALGLSVATYYRAEAEGDATSTSDARAGSLGR